MTFDALSAGSATEVQINFSTWVKGVCSTTGQRAVDKRINKNRKPRSAAENGVRAVDRGDNQWVGSGGGADTTRRGSQSQRDAHAQA